ncbi:GIY-YIG nuclease family protein [Aurantiacibacter spongiae]|uniref:GIY-YIG nuclease family protein n=1 Tax=Aurantiacibacter spongiae TaxID=2488860 RepID=A0A3N5DH25_9SPHN|nr:GIY-YIG nuclease family protein [Aurantiacibacter spongiae]RPF70972.1 GIY-YIG nuclease family protein [Aurantiacibacter spongiae]
MALTFNMVLKNGGLDPFNVRLMRHQHVADSGLTPYALWRDDRAEFERYQSAQRANRREYFASRYWASFVVPPDGSTMFAGMYEVFGSSPAPDDWVDPLYRLSRLQMNLELDLYECSRLPAFDPFIGCLKVEWGPGARSWAQRADSNTGDKPIVELTQTFREPDFPGFTHFVENLASLPSLPPSWVATLSASRGVYLLTCPRTREQYVGAAHGFEGFWGRWQSYIATGHGGNVGLKSRDPSDYQVSILEVAGSAATVEQIIAMEQLWKRKLQSREMGLNKN